MLENSRKYCISASKHRTTLHSLKLVYFLVKLYSVTPELWLQLSPQLAPLCSYRTPSLEFLGCLYWGGVEGEGGAALSCPAPWPRPSQDEAEAALVPWEGEWPWWGLCWGWGAGVGERSRAYSLARGPCLRSQCFSNACGFTTCPQWLHTTR